MKLIEAPKMGEEEGRGKRLKPFQSHLAILGVLTGSLNWKLIRSEESMTTRVRPLNLECCFLPSKVASDTPILGRLWPDKANILVDL